MAEKKKDIEDSELNSEDNKDKTDKPVEEKESLAIEGMAKSPPSEIPVSKEDTTEKKTKNKINILKYQPSSKQIYFFLASLIVIIFILITFIIWTNHRYRAAEERFAIRVQEIKETLELNENEKALLRRSLENDLIILFDSLITQSEGNINQAIKDIMKNDTINQELQEIYNRLLLRNEIKDDEYIRIVRNGIGRDISISNEEVISLLYILLVNENHNSDRFEIASAKGGNIETIFLLDNHNGNIWMYENGSFKLVKVEDLDKVNNDDELLKVIEKLVKSTRGGIIDLRSKNTSK